MNKVTPLVVVPARECMCAGEAQRWPGVAVPPRGLPRRPLLCLAPERRAPPGQSAGARLKNKGQGRRGFSLQLWGSPTPGRGGREGDRGCAAASGRASFPAAARAGRRRAGGGPWFP